MIEMNTTYKHLRYIEKLMRGVPTTQDEFDSFFRHIHTKDYKIEKPNSKADKRSDLFKPRRNKH